MAVVQGLYPGMMHRIRVWPRRSSSCPLFLPLYPDLENNKTVVDTRQCIPQVSIVERPQKAQIDNVQRNPKFFRKEILVSKLLYYTVLWRLFNGQRVNNARNRGEAELLCRLDPHTVSNSINKILLSCQ